MSSDRRLRANQENARSSTGPKTPEGKARSSQNARKHGLTAREVFVAPDQQEEFDEFLAAYQDDLQPQGMLEQDLFNQLVAAAWNLRRIRCLEADLATHSDPLGSDLHEPALLRLARYHGRAERTYFRCLREMKALQTNRALREGDAPGPPPLASVTKLTKRTQPRPAPKPPGGLLDPALDWGLHPFETQPLPPSVPLLTFAF
jgi:hypothetical protein